MPSDNIKAEGNANGNGEQRKVVMSEEALEHYRQFAQHMKVMRDATEGNPRPALMGIAGDVHMGGPNPGLLDALSRGVLKEAGYNGKRDAEAQKAIHRIMDEHREKAIAEIEKAIGREVSVAELASEDLHNVMLLCRTYMEQEYGDRYEKERKDGSIADADIVTVEARSGGGVDPMYA